MHPSNTNLKFKIPLNFLVTLLVVRHGYGMSVTMVYSGLFRMCNAIADFFIIYAIKEMKVEQEKYFTMQSSSERVFAENSASVHNFAR